MEPRLIRRDVPLPRPLLETSHYHENLPSDSASPVSISGHSSGNLSLMPVHFLPSPVSAISPQHSSLDGGILQPTWTGFLQDTKDALLLLEACLQGKFQHVPRRPHDRERPHIIAPGSIVVYDENASGIRRWTDGITWSPSRIMGNYLVYGELRDGHLPGEKKRACRKRKRADSPKREKKDSTLVDEDRAYIGSLSLNAYNFKPDGLTKKTISIICRGQRHHIISYYRLGDVKNGLYLRPSQCHAFQSVVPRSELMAYSFKCPIDGFDGNGKPDPYMSLYQQRQQYIFDHPVISKVPRRVQMSGDGIVSSPTNSSRNRSQQQHQQQHQQQQRQQQGPASRVTEYPSNNWAPQPLNQVHDNSLIQSMRTRLNPPVQQIGQQHYSGAATAPPVRPIHPLTDLPHHEMNTHYGPRTGNHMQQPEEANLGWSTASMPPRSEQYVLQPMSTPSYSGNYASSPGGDYSYNRGIVSTGVGPAPHNYYRDVDRVMFS